MPDPGTGAAVRLAEHRLLLTDQHVPDDRAVPRASGRREAEQGTATQGGRQLGLPVGRVAEEQHVGVVGHAGQDGQGAPELLSPHGDQHQVEAIICGELADRRRRHHGAVPGLGILEDQPMGLQVDQTGTAGQEDHVVPGPQKPARVHAADHAGAEHQNPHQCTSDRHHLGAVSQPHRRAAAQPHSSPRTTLPDRSGRSCTHARRIERRTVYPAGRLAPIRPCPPRLVRSGVQTISPHELHLVEHSRAPAAGQQEHRVLRVGRSGLNDVPVDPGRHDGSLGSPCPRDARVRRTRAGVRAGTVPHLWSAAPLGAMRRRGRSSNRTRGVDPRRGAR